MHLNIFTYQPKFLLKIFDLGANPSINSKTSEYIKLWNKSFLLLSLLFFFISICDFIWIRSVISYSFFLLAVIFFYMLFTDLKFNRQAQIFVYLFLSFVFFYMSSHTSLNSGIYLFYVPLILSLLSFLSFREDKWSVFLICFFILFELVLIFMTNTISEDPKEKIIFIESLMTSILFISWVVYFILKKQWLQIKHYKYKEVMKAEELGLDEDKILEVISMAKKNDNLFFANFQNLYPYFCEQLKQLQPTVAASELEFCAYLKLNFTTKEIARYTNSSIRSVEGKKYRIRKKYNIPERIDVYVYMANL